MTDPILIDMSADLLALRQFIPRYEAPDVGPLLGVFRRGAVRERRRCLADPIGDLESWWAAHQRGSWKDVIAGEIGAFDE